MHTYHWFFSGHVATSFVGVGALDALAIVFNIRSVHKRQRMTLRHALLVTSHATKCIQGISAMI